MDTINTVKGNKEHYVVHVIEQLVTKPWLRDQAIGLGVGVDFSATGGGLEDGSSSRKRHGCSHSELRSKISILRPFCFVGRLLNIRYLSFMNCSFLKR